MKYQIDLEMLKKIRDGEANSHSSKKIFHFVVLMGLCLATCGLETPILSILFFLIAIGEVIFSFISSGAKDKEISEEDIEIEAYAIVLEKKINETERYVDNDDMPNLTNIEYRYMLKLRYEDGREKWLEVTSLEYDCLNLEDKIAIFKFKSYLEFKNMKSHAVLLCNQESFNE